MHLFCSSSALFYKLQVLSNRNTNLINDWEITEHVESCASFHEAHVRLSLAIKLTCYGCGENDVEVTSSVLVPAACWALFYDHRVHWPSVSKNAWLWTGKGGKECIWGITGTSSSLKIIQSIDLFSEATVVTFRVSLTLQCDPVKNWTGTQTNRAGQCNLKSRDKQSNHHREARAKILLMKLPANAIPWKIFNLSKT